MEIYVWFFTVAVIFTFVGYGWGVKTQINQVVNNTINRLIVLGYIKYRKKPSGEIEILKYDQND